MFHVFNRFFDANLWFPITATWILLLLLWPIARIAAVPPTWQELAQLPLETTASEMLYTFEQFVMDFNKDYDNDPAEYNYRKSIFQDNMRQIHHYNHLNHYHRLVGRAAANASMSVSIERGHVLGINLFTDMLAEEMPMGYVKKHHVEQFKQQQQHAEWNAFMSNHVQQLDPLDQLPFDLDPVEELPLSIDWRKHGVTTPVKSQGQCGSCWAFASTAVLESHIAIQTGKLFEFSMQEFVSCASNPLHCGGNGGCTGATAEIAFDHAAKHGLVQEWEFGYQSYHGKEVECTLQPEVTPNEFIRADGAHLRGSNLIRDNGSPSFYQGSVASIAGYVKLPTNSYEALMNAVAKVGPVAVSVACLPWHLYSGGVFAPAPLNTTRATDVDHLVVLEGYGTDANTGEDYWLIRNSWSPMWGESGYIRLLRSPPPSSRRHSADDNDDDDDDSSYCGMDTTPADGVGCTQDENGNPIQPPPSKICGNSGILYDTAIPVGGALVTPQQQQQQQQHDVLPQQEPKQPGSLTAIMWT